MTGWFMGQLGGVNMAALGVAKYQSWPRAASPTPYPQAGEVMWERASVYCSHSSQKITFCLFLGGLQKINTTFWGKTLL